MWGWAKKANASREALDSERSKLSMSIELLETKRRDADTAYRRAVQSKIPRVRLRALLEARNSLDRRLAVAGRLQNKVSLCDPMFCATEGGGFPFLYDFIIIGGVPPLRFHYL